MGTGWEKMPEPPAAGVAREEGHMGVRSAKRESRGRSTEEKAKDGRSQTEHKMGRERCC